MDRLTDGMVVDFRSMHLRSKEEGYHKISENILSQFFPNVSSLTNKTPGTISYLHGKGKNLTASASKAVLTTKKGLVQEPGNAQKIQYHSGYNT